jgi:glycosyltransferase involved in cell wall biosynthesis
MRIAHLGVKGLPSKSGTERVIEAIVTQMIGKFDITIYCDADYTPPDTHYKGVRLIRISTLKGRHLKPISLGVFSALHALFFGHYDIIHMHGVENCFTLPLLRLRYRVISTAHGALGRMPISKWSKTELLFFKMAEYPFLYLSNYSTSVSTMDTNYLYSKYGKKAIYIPNGVDLHIPVNREVALNELRRIGVSPNGFLLFIAARIIERKGCHLILEALNDSNLDIPLVIIGDLEQVPTYGQKLREMAKHRQVIFVPPIADRSLLFGIVELCKLFVFPSTAEGMSIMLLEAASLGIPMICSDIPENKAVLGDYVTYFRSGDSSDLAEKIHWAMESPEKLIHLALLAKKWTKDNFSWDLIASRYELLYQNCVNRVPANDVLAL